MTTYGQYCPVAKATEIIGEKWTLLILRELLFGTHRFNDIQRAMSRISPTILAKRLKQLEDKGIVTRKRLPGQKSHEYRLTPMGRELEPLIEQLAVWGQRWARGQMSDDELDVELLMWDIQRNIDTAHLPGGVTVLAFIFSDLGKYKNWWLVIDGDDVDLCTEDPGRDVDVFLASDIRTMIDVWQGDTELADALADERILATGTKPLLRSMPKWFALCRFADVKSMISTGVVA